MKRGTKNDFDSSLLPFAIPVELAYEPKMWQKHIFRRDCCVCRIYGRIQNLHFLFAQWPRLGICRFQLCMPCIVSVTWFTSISMHRLVPDQSICMGVLCVREMIWNCVPEPENTAFSQLTAVRNLRFYCSRVYRSSFEQRLLFSKWAMAAVNSDSVRLQTPEQSSCSFYTPNSTWHLNFGQFFPRVLICIVSTRCIT